MGIASLVAAHIDRLVWSVNGAIGPAHGDDLDRLAEAHGLDSAELLVHLADFLVAGALTTDVAVLRLRYMPREAVIARLDELMEGGFVMPIDDRLTATPSLRPVLDAIQAAKGDIAGRLWGDHFVLAETLSGLCRKVAMAASDRHVVAVAHRALPEPDDPYLLLYQRLVTLRYVRQHDHAAAWMAKDLTAAEAVILTTLWSGDQLTSGAEVDRLVERGIVDGTSMRLTPVGSELRNEIEVDTNTRVAAAFDTLETGEAATFVEAIRELPGAPVQ